MPNLLRYLIQSNHWLINAEPHVVVKLKRVFAKINKAAHGELGLLNTVENCRDLLWFNQRYPFEISKLDLKILSKGARTYDQQCETRVKILSGDISLSSVDMKIQPREYQKIAAQLWLNQGYLLLGDDLGVGKTCSAICGLVDKRTRPALITTLPHLCRQWGSEIEKFAPQLTYHILKQATPYQIKKINGSDPDIIICNYHKLNGWADELSGKIKSVVFDEIQELRHNESAKYSAALHISRKSKYRLGLSGTPIYNYGGEMVNVINCLKEDALGSSDEFHNEWCDGIKVSNPKAFGAYLRESGIMLRRTRKDVGREVPEISRITHVVESDAAALEKIKGSAVELARLILSESKERKGSQFSAAGEFDMLVRQATGIAKAPYVAEFVRLLVQSGESVVLFAWHRAVYDILYEKLKDLNPAFYTGNESESQKAASKESFTSKKSPLLIMSLRAGAGVDGLQYVCRTVVLGELDYSPAVMEQCIGRVARDGQTDPVSAYTLISDDGSDPIIADILGLKDQQLQGIKNPEQDIIEKIIVTGDHVKKLAQYYLSKRKDPFDDF